MPSLLRIFIIIAAGFVAVFFIAATTVVPEPPAPPYTTELLFENIEKLPPQEKDNPPVETPAEQITEEKKPQTTISGGVEQVAKTLTVPAPLPVSPISLNEKARDALVNVLCVPQTNGVVHSITGSGVFIDPRGVILTNAHVAQYFLLEDYPAPDFLNCVIRTGSPARSAYAAKLLYFPPSWMRENAAKIDDEAPTGNGEHDYALLYVTDSLDKNKPLPDTFPSLPLLYTEVETADDVLVAGYPAGFLGGITIAKELYAVSSPAKVGELYTYATSTADIFSVGGSIVAQQGSSGGAVVDATGNLVGLIVTSTIAPDTSSRDLHAVASSYIARDFEGEYGASLPVFLSRNMKEAADAFAKNTAPGLTAQLLEVLVQ